jgi:hypothetical protein
VVVKVLQRFWIGGGWRSSGISLAVVALVVAGSAACASAATQTFLYTGTEQTFIVPLGVQSVEVVAIGGNGGSADAIAGGVPAKVSADLSVSPGQLLYVEVAGNGESASNSWAGGFNGGGAAGGSDASGGGGASDLRTVPRTSGLSPDSRLIVAGGGGGAAEGSGGAAGSDGANGNAPGEGGGAGTLTAGGAHGTGGCGDGSDGLLGMGGDGGMSTVTLGRGAGGGGGGYYGGAGGNAGCMSGGGGGGGGSSFVASGASNTSMTTDMTGVPLVQITPKIPASAALPSNRFRFGRLRLNRKNGTATLAVKLPGPGTLGVKGKGVVRQRRAVFAGVNSSRAVNGPGSVKVHITAKAKQRRKLDRTGRVMLRVIVTFTPTSGTPNSKGKRIRLEKNP